MTRAEEAARDYILTSASPFPNIETAAVIYGYMRAEKDLALTWEDMRKIIRIDEEMTVDPEAHPEWMEEQPFYEEVLKRFKEAKQ